MEEQSTLYQVLHCAMCTLWLNLKVETKASFSLSTINSVHTRGLTINPIDTGALTINPIHTRTLTINPFASAIFLY